ncbi:MAG: hypothetical protein WC997_00135 [Porticoccaceae bacterium]
MTALGRCLRKWASLLCGLCLCHGALGEDIVLVLSEKESYYEEVAEGIVDYLRRAQPGVEVRTQVLTDGVAVAADDLVITIGSAASARVMAHHPQVKQLSLLITRQAWRGMLPGATTATKAAVLMDQPAERYLRLARLLAPRGSLSAVFGPAAQDLRDSFLHAAHQLDETLRHAAIDRDSNPMHVLNPLLENSAAFIAVPDQAEFNRSIARWVLRLGFRKRVPVIGFSRSYVEAGAAAALFSAPRDVEHEAIDWLTDYFDGAKAALWAEHAPRHFTVALNHSVARSLGLELLDEEEIHRRIAAPLAWSESE